MKRYNYVCIEGNIGAGKTTLTELLAKDWEAYPIFEQFTDNPFLPLFYTHPERYAFQVELFFMTERHKQLENIKPDQDIFQQLYLGDYFFQKTRIFAGHTLKSDEYELFMRLFNTLNNTAPVPDLLVYLHRPVDVIFDQIKSRNRGMESDITKDYLVRVQRAYLDYFRVITHMPILVIELGEMDFLKNREDYELVKEMIDRNYQPGLNSVSLTRS